jgi:hypothetical protein
MRGAPEDQKVYDFVTSTLYPRQRASYAGDLEIDAQQFQQQNQRIGILKEPMQSRLVRNYVYKPLLHCYVF